jgi:hypothetical protein
MWKITILRQKNHSFYNYGGRGENFWGKTILRHPKIFAPSSSRGNFFKWPPPPPLAWNPGSAPAKENLGKFEFSGKNVFIYYGTKWWILCTAPGAPPLPPGSAPVLYAIFPLVILVVSWLHNIRLQIIVKIHLFQEITNFFYKFIKPQFFNNNKNMQSSFLHQIRVWSWIFTPWILLEFN